MHTVKASENTVEEILSLTDGLGAEAVIDFVAEGDAVQQGIDMTRNAGTYFIVGYGGHVHVPTIDMIFSEKTIAGSLVGTYPELVELMELADRGLVNLSTKEYRLSEANQALRDLNEGKVKGRAVLIPWGHLLRNDFAWFLWNHSKFRFVLSDGGGGRFFTPYLYMQRNEEIFRRSLPKDNSNDKRGRRWSKFLLLEKGQFSIVSKKKDSGE